MNAVDYRTSLNNYDSQICQLLNVRLKMVETQKALIKQDLKDIGLVPGQEVHILDGIIERNCTSVDVIESGGFFSLMFQYRLSQQEMNERAFLMKSPYGFVDTNHSIKVILPDATFDYHQFMSNYQ